MVSQSEVIFSRVANSTRANKCKVVKGTRPLVNFNFYLDIANHHVSLKIETKIKELGGSIDFFLTESVTHFITDKLADSELINNSSTYTASTTRISSTSNCDKIGNNDLKGEQKIKSRADAMLHRARKDITKSVNNFTSSQANPTQVAKARGTPIWNIDFALRFLEKANVVLRKHYKNTSSQKSKERIGNAKVLKGDFIKIEATQNSYRPYYQLLTNGKWPTIILNSSRDSSVFQYSNECCDFKTKCQEENSQTLRIQSLEMTRKSRSSKHIRVKSDKKIPSEKQCGYCEICRVEYDILNNHLKTEEHINFVKNDSNFLELDSLIKSKTNINSFLAFSKDKIFKDDNFEMFSKRESKRTIMGNQTKRSNLSGEDNLEEINSTTNTRQTRQTSGKQSDNMSFYENQIKSTGIMRSRRESLKKINYAEPKEDEENSSDMITEKQSGKKHSEVKVKKNCNNKVRLESSPPRSKPKAPLLYKVVDRNDKCAGDKKEPLSEKNNEQSIIVKFRKIRQTEISLLNGEAENFMFPKKLSSELSTDVDMQTTSGSGRSSTSIISSEKAVKRKISLSSHNNVVLDDVGPPKKKKISSVQNLNSRSSNVRVLDQNFQKSPIHQRRKMYAKRNKSNKNAKEKSNNAMGEIKATNLKAFLDGELNHYTFSFERIPHSEVWYQVFHRQDESREKMFEYYGNTAYRKLPYEMGPLPPLQPKFCTLCLRNDALDKGQSKVLEAINKSAKNSEKAVQDANIARKKYKTNKLLNSDLPRKSPREHASTLAILSCLIHKRTEKANQDKDEKIAINSSSNEIQDIEEKLQRKLCQDKNEQQDQQQQHNLNITTQISENVKRLRRGEKLKSNAAMFSKEKKLKLVCTKPKISPKKKYVNKPLEFHLDGSNEYKQNESYVNASTLNKEIDNHLSNTFDQYGESDEINLLTEDYVDRFSFDCNLEDLMLDSSTNVGKNICGRTKAACNKLRLFNIFSTNKKRKNKTGWPTKKKVVTRQQQLLKNPNSSVINLHPGVSIHNKEIKNECVPNPNASSTTPTENVNEGKVESDGRIENNKDCVNEKSFGVSEKIDHSDITLSSDSLDTVLDVGSQMKSEDQQEVIESSKSNIKLTIHCSDKKATKNAYSKIYNSRNRRPIVKAGVKSVQQNNYKSNQCNNNLATDDALDSLSSISKEKTDSPNKQQQGDRSTSVNVSPRRLRKPRGKWYRER